MSVLVETSLGDLVIDLLTEHSPKACENFLKLCKVKYYNYAPVYNLQKGFAFQTGDPLGPDSAESDGGTSIWGLIEGPTKRHYILDTAPKLKHDQRGTVSMATIASSGDIDQRMAASQFLITLSDHADHLDGRAAVFGRVVEGFDVLDKINSSYTDNEGRPLRDIRVRHTVVLDDPYPDIPGLREPDDSPVPTKAQLATVRIADDEDIENDLDEKALEELHRDREARAQALTLEMVGDLPFAEVKPPENVLFVCKLNPVTQDEDLELIFSRFGRILSCEVIRDKKTKDSLQYAFIEFEEKKNCEQAYFKMQGVLIDDHRIHVDFSQSVSRLSDTWRDATNSRRRKQANYGGIAGLERKRQYRNIEERGSDSYGMVYEREQASDERLQTRDQFSRPIEKSSRTDAKRRDRSRSPEYSKRHYLSHQDRGRDSRDRRYERERHRNYR